MPSIAELRIRSADLKDRLAAVLLDEHDWDKLTPGEQEDRLTQAEPLAAQLREIDREITDIDRATAAAETTMIRAAHVAQPMFASTSDALALVAGGPAMHSTHAAMPARSITMRAPYEDQPGIGFGRFVKVTALARGSRTEALGIARQMYGSDVQLQAALQQGVGTTGGFLVPDGQSREIIELLKHRTVIRQFGRAVPLAGTMAIPVQTSGVTATWLGEGQDDTAQDLGFGQRRLTGRKLRAMVPISNDLLRNSSPEADTIVRDELVGSLAVSEDLAYIRSTGVGNAPKGLRYWAPSAAVVNGVGTSAANIEADLIAMAARLAAGLKGNLRSPRWIMPSRSYYTLYGLRESNGNLVFAEIRGAEPMLLGMPVSVTDLIPTNLSPGTATEIYLSDANDWLVGTELELQIGVSDVASYKDATGTMQSSWSRDESVVRAIAISDFALARDEAVQILFGSTTTW